MKQSEIKVGGRYLARISGKIVPVRVEAIRDTLTARRGPSRYDGKSHTWMSRTRLRLVYDVTNLATGRKTTFRSAAKFRGVVASDGGFEYEPPKPKANTSQFGSPQTGFPEDGGTVGGPSFLPEFRGPAPAEPPVEEDKRTAEARLLRENLKNSAESGDPLG